MFCPKCGAQLPESASFCGACGAQVPLQESAVSPLRPEYPMKWYKFLIYFSLFAGAILNILTGLQYFMGTPYVSQGVTPQDLQQAYAMFPSLQMIDFVYGAACVGVGIFGFFVRSALKNYEQSGPAKLYVLYACLGIFPVVYNYAVCMALGESFSLVLGECVGDLLGQGLILLLNFVYFKKRKDLFVY